MQQASQGKLSGIVGALGPATRLARRLDGRKQQANQYSNNCYNYE
jgi:hypothetical protein